MFTTGEGNRGRDSDYVLRLVRQIGQALASVMRLRNSGEHDDAQAQLEESYRELLATDPKMLRLLDASALGKLYAGDGKGVALGLLMVEEALLLEAMGDRDRANALARRAVAVLAVAGPVEEEATKVVADALEAAQRLSGATDTAG